MSVLAALDRLLETEARLAKAEATAPLEKRAERAIAAAFRGQRDAAVRRLEQIGPHFGLDEALRREDRERLLALLLAALALYPGLRTALAETMLAARAAGVASVPEAVDLAVPLPTEAQVAAEATSLADQLNATTARDVGAVLDQAVSGVWRMRIVIVQVRRVFDGYLAPGGRAALVAGEETNRAFEDGRLRAAQAAHLRQVRWLTVGDSRVDGVCLRNEAAGWIPLTALFPSGDDRPPAHVGCRCVTDFAGGEEDEST